MSWKSPIPTRSLLLLSFLLVLSGPALEGCQSASVGDTSGAKPPEAAEEHESNRIYKNAGKVCCIQTFPDSNLTLLLSAHLNSNHWYVNTDIFSFLTRGMGISMNMKMCTMLEMVITGKAMFLAILTITRRSEKHIIFNWTYSDWQLPIIDIWAYRYLFQG